VKDGPEYGVSINAEMDFYIAKTPTAAQIGDRIKIRFIQGFGILLAKLDGSQFELIDDHNVFQDATITRAKSELMKQFFLTSTEKNAALDIGKALYTGSQARVLLSANGFDRHSFLCGQSGSGKTFALGVLLEQIMLETKLRVVILDPNSDFVSLDKIRKMADANKTRSIDFTPQQYNEISTRYATVPLKVMRPIRHSKNLVNTLRIRFSDLDPYEQAAVLKMDPLANREEFYSYRNFIENIRRKKYSLSDIQAAISNNYSAEARQTGLRIRNLGVADWEIWSPASEQSLSDVLLQKDWRCLVVDIGTLSSSSEKSVIATALLGHFWRHRNSKKPTLIVIDEAHNICPKQSSIDLDVLSTDYVVRIAGEGRKFGLYLLIGTQRPEKIHPNVISQCDNLILMKMNSRGDLSYISEMFSQVPVSLLDLSPSFRQGEALLAGKYVPSPTLVKFEGRLSIEGGSDVPSPWAARRK
jgi:DNA helicase HerA-like ATPase